MRNDRKRGGMLHVMQGRLHKQICNWNDVFICNLPFQLFSWDISEAFQSIVWNPMWIVVLLACSIDMHTPRWLASIFPWRIAHQTVFDSSPFFLPSTETNAYGSTDLISDFRAQNTTKVPNTVHRSEVKIVIISENKFCSLWNFGLRGNVRILVYFGWCMGRLMVDNEWVQRWCGPQPPWNIHQCINRFRGPPSLQHVWRKSCIVHHRTVVYVSGGYFCVHYKFCDCFLLLLLPQKKKSTKQRHENHLSSRVKFCWLGASGFVFASEQWLRGENRKRC